ncbi:shikimate kinase [Pseudogracilibacillus sp. SO30301A]|uniref:shikimate kinase n=1 Tax=Pseudogracilibacillus sp. SO30301A TaxID=3098291 RepID=UPI00300DDEBE
MKIVLTGVSCVGKSTIGKMLANKVGYTFFDFDYEIENYFNRPISISFLKREFLTEYSYRKEVRVVLSKILEENEDNFIVAMPPSGLMDFYWRIIKQDDSLLTVVLKDRAKNILQRTRFYDDNSNPIEVELSKERERYYLKEISLDIEYFGRTYNRSNYQYRIAGKSASEAVDDLEALLF